jgi:hypothetical protein
MIALNVGACAAVLAMTDRFAGAMDATPRGISLLFPVLAVVGAADLALAWLLPRLMGGQRRLRATMSAADPQAPLESPARSSHGVNPLRAGLEAVFALHVVRIALIESVAVYGLILSILTGDPRYCIGFILVAFFATLQARFDPAPVEDLYRRMLNEDAWRR